MPNKYSHALVLSHYEARGLVDFYNHPNRQTPTTSPVSVDRTHFEHRQQTPRVTRYTPAPPPVTNTPPITTSTRQPSIASKPTTPVIAAPRTVFDDSPPSTPEPPRYSIARRYAPSTTRRSRRSSLDWEPRLPSRTTPPATSRGYRHIESDPLAPPRLPPDHKSIPPITTTHPQPLGLKELSQNTIRPFKVSLEHVEVSPTTKTAPHSLGLKELHQNTIKPFQVSLEHVEAGPTTKPAPRSLGLKELLRGIQAPHRVSLDSNDARPSISNLFAPRPRTAGATETSTSPIPSRPQTLTPALSSQSSRSSHCTTDSIVTQIYAPESISQPPTPPRSSASFETAIFAPPASPSKSLPHHEPPAIPPRSSSIPRPRSSSAHHPDFDAFSSTNSPTMSSPNSTFTNSSSFHQTPRTSYSRITPSLPSKSPEREFDFHPDKASAINPEVVPFSHEPGEPWGALEELPAIFRVSMDSEQYTLDVPSTRSSSFDEAAPPPITRTPRTKGLNPTTTKKPRRMSLTLFRPDCEAILYDQTTSGPAPIPITTVKDARIQENSAVMIDKEYGKKTGKRTSWGLMGRVSAVRDPFEDKRRGRGFSRAVGTGFM